MQWFQIKEQAAGEKRLILSWYLYRCFGKKILYIIAFFVTVFTFIFASKIRGFSKKYLEIIQPYTNLKPNLINEFKHIHSYACSLVDKMLVYYGDFVSENLVFENEEDKIKLFEDINKGNGAFFICSHIGNIEVLQFLLANQDDKFDVNIFLSNKQSQIFNKFLNKIKQNITVNQFIIEKIGLETGIELKENLDKGGIVFIAGDRLSENNSQQNISCEMFRYKIFLPKGTFKIAELMNVPTYFISVLKFKNQYKIYLEKQKTNNFEELTNSYVKYLEKTILSAPLQFYNFYDFFKP